LKKIIYALTTIVGVQLLNKGEMERARGGAEESL